MTVSFRRSSQSFLAIDKTSYTHHFEQFVLFRRSDVFQYFRNQLGTDTFFYGLLDLKRISDRRFAHFNDIAGFDGT